MKAIVGLGNPGREYELTRHNAGFLVVDALLEESGGTWSTTRFNGLSARITVDRETVLLAKPMTYMNRSGHFISSLLHYFRVEVEDLLVVHDEMDLPTGRIRLTRGGGSAGHRGVDSTIEQLGSRGFARLRVGVGKPTSKEQVVGHVLSRIGGGEEAVFDQAVAHSAAAAKVWVGSGITEAMNRYNGLQLDLERPKGGE
jgi:PTH1 family peptidyl-tRNA hydrolase